MLVRIKTNPDTVISDVISSLDTIISGSLTVSGGKPTNLTNMDQAKSEVYGSTYTDTNSLYTSNINGTDLEITKIHSGDANDSVKVALRTAVLSLEPYEITPAGRTDDVVSYNPVDGLFPIALSSFIDVVINDDILFIQGPAGLGSVETGTSSYYYDPSKVFATFAIYQIKENAGTALTPNLCKFAIDLSGFTDAQTSTHFGRHSEINLPYVNIGGTYQSGGVSDDLCSFATDGIVASSGSQVFVMDRVYAGSFSSGLYELSKVFAIGNNPSFPPGVIQNTNNDYYLMTGKLGSAGTGSFSSGSSASNYGNHVLIEVE